MADTRASTGLTVEQWDDKFFTEYLSDNRFSSDMGTTQEAIIQVKENLNKNPGDRINFALVNRLQQDATTGRDVMEGNEENLVSRSHKIEVDKRRNAVRVPEMDEQVSAISLRNAAKPALKEWSMKDTEHLLIQALGSKNGVNYADADETARDAWLTNNRDRVFFASGYSGTDHSAGLLELDTTNDRCTAARLKRMKYMARVTADPKVRPIRSSSGGRHFYIAYADPRCFRDLQDDSVITQAQREVSVLRENERLFKGGDLLWDNIVIKEITDMYDILGPDLKGAGTGGTNDVGCVFLCGAQALGIAYAKRWKTVNESFDYGDKLGVEVHAIYGVDKLIFGTGNTGDTSNPKDHGIVTGYFAVSD